MIIGIDASRAFVPDPAGPEYYSWHLIRNISKINKSNQIILYLRPGQKSNFRLPKNVKTRVIPLKYLWTQLGLARETVLRPPDVLFVPAHTLPLLARIFRPRLPIVVTIHGLEGKYLPQTSKFLTHIYRNLSITWAVRLATRLIAVSEDTKKDIIKTYRISAKRIKVIQEGVEFGRFARKIKKQIVKIKKRYDINNSYILFVGTVQPRKNLVRLIQAFALLTNSNELSLVIAGKLGWLYEDILKAPSRFNVENRVKFIGRVEDSDLPALYQNAEVFVLPSLTEGFGLPILEAQAAGIPVVAAKKGAIPEVAGDGALLLDPYKTKEIKDAIIKTLQDKDLRADLIRKGRKNAKKFSWTNTADSTLKYLLETQREKIVR